MVRAIYDFIAANTQELSFKKYDLMAIDLHPKDRYPVPFDEDDRISDHDESGEAEGGEGNTMDASQRSNRGRWWKASLTRRSTTGGTTTLTGWIPVNLVTDEAWLLPPPSPPPSSPIH
jgi:hypothetical protein